MKNQYNIVLIPLNKKNSFIKYSHYLSGIADTYLLGENSLPHVTIYQFQASESEIKSIWENACEKINQASLQLSFREFSCITFDKKIFWASLLPDNIDVLMKMHAIIADVVKQPVKANYDPHLTLINTKDSTYENLVNQLSERYSPIKDTFILALGRSDEIGQFTEVIFSCAKIT